MAVLLNNTPLIDADGKSVDASIALENKLVALYFSAHWCGPCQRFTPVLKDLYEVVQEEQGGGVDFEVVFVSSDDSQQQFDEYRAQAHGSWLSVAYDAVAKRNELKQKYGACAQKEQRDVGVTDRRTGIPALIVVDPYGRELSFDGVKEVDDAGPTAVKRWRQMFSSQ